MLPFIEYVAALVAAQIISSLILLSGYWIFSRWDARREKERIRAMIFRPAPDEHEPEPDEHEPDEHEPDEQISRDSSVDLGAVVEKITRTAYAS
jgi:hypothetical protein